PVDSVWRVPLAADRSPITLLDVARDQDRMLNPHPYRYVQFRAETVEGSQPDRSALRVQVESFEPDPHHYAVRSFLGNEYRLRLDAPEGYGVLKVRARTSGAEAERLEVALVDVDGVAWGAVIPLTANWRDIEVQISELRPVTLALLPRPYPEFLPNEGPAPAPDGPLDLRRVDGVQVRIGSSLYPSSAAPGPHGFEIERVVLERGP